MNNQAKIGINNIQRINFEKFDKDFSFIVNGKCFKTNSFVACILSPNISKMFQENMHLSYYEINTEDDGDFNQIIKYGEMKSINIKEDEQPYFANVMKILGNNNEFLQFSKEFQEEISFENVTRRIQIKKELGVDFNNEITFISNNFHYFCTNSPESIITLDIDIIEQIISNNQLKLFNEDELFNIVLKLYIKSKEYSSLFSFVVFMNLSTESIREFIQNFDINDINISIWKNIISRLEQDISAESIQLYQKSHQEFLNNRYTSKRYEQIIQHLSEKCSGNVHAQNIVQITASSLNNEYYIAQNVVEHNDDKYFESKNEANSWILFDFKDRTVLFDSYTLKTMNWNVNSGHLKSWILEVSNDSQNYIEIDRHENCDLLNGPLKTSSFKVSCLTPQRFVRLTQIGSNWIGNYCMCLNQIEFSGVLYE